MPQEPTPGLAVALGSSLLGYYAHSGFLNGLATVGLHPEKVSGASAGAIAGAFYASGLRGDALRDRALNSSLRWSFADWGAFVRLPGVLSALWASGIFSGRRAVRHIDALFEEDDLSELKSPTLEIAVTDADRYRTQICRSGKLAELIVASCAVPGLFTIQKVGGRRYIDGGVACEAPFEQWLDDSSIETIVVHRIRHEEGTGPAVSWETIATSIGAAHSTVCEELHNRRRELAKLKGKRLIEVDTSTPVPGLFSQKRAPLCYNRGYDSGCGVVL